MFEHPLTMCRDYEQGMRSCDKYNIFADSVAGTLVLNLDYFFCGPNEC